MPSLFRPAVFSAAAVLVVFPRAAGDVLVDLDPSAALYDSDIKGLVNDTNADNRPSGVPDLDNTHHPLGHTFNIEFTPAAADLSGTVLLIEIGGTANGTGLYLVNGVPTLVAKHDSSSGAYPASLHHTALPAIAVQSGSGPLQAGVSHSFSASWDHVHTLELVVKADALPAVTDSFVISGSPGNWSGNDTLSVKNKPAAGSTGGLTSAGGTPFSTGSLKNFAGGVSRALFWNASSLTPLPGTPPPPTLTRTVTRDGQSRTVHFALHPIRNANHNVRIQDASGAFTLYTPDVPRTYIGTVENEPGAIAAGLLRANGDFLSHIIFENGTVWNTSGGTTSASGPSSWNPAWPTGNLPPAAGAGSSVYAAELGIDISYRQFLATGSNLDATIELSEYSVMKANVVYLRDAAILHRIGRFLIRTDAAPCPYEAIGNSPGDLLPAFRNEWNNILPATPHLLPRTHDLALLVKPDIGGGLAYVGTIATASSYSVNGGGASGDFTAIWRHEAGHNWGSSHYEGGGKPEGPTIMSDNNLARFSSSELAKIISHRNSKASALDNLGAYSFPLPPRANQDRATLAESAGSAVLDVLANDSDSNGETLSLLSAPDFSTQGGLIARLPADASSPRERLAYYAPPHHNPAPEDFDHFDYRIQDAAGFTATSKVYLRSVPLPSHPPGWTGLDIGSTGLAGDSGDTANANSILYGAGAGIGSTSDAFHLAARDFAGDGSLTTRVLAQANTHPSAKAGLILRDGISPSAAFALVAVTPQNGYLFQYRTAAGLSAVETSGPPLHSPSNNWLRLTREGDLISAWSSSDGDTWTLIGSATVPLPATASAGFAVTGNSTTAYAAAAFGDVAVIDSNPNLTGLDDTFDIGLDPTPGNDPDDPLDTQWFAVNATHSLAADATLGSGRALEISPTGGFGAIRGRFSGRPLSSVGDSLTFSFDFRYTELPTAGPGGFRFGIFNGNGDGYFVRHGTGNRNNYVLLRDHSADLGFGTVNDTASILAETTKPPLADLAKHTATFQISRTSGGFALTATVDGIPVSANETDPVDLAFDTVVILNGQNILQPFRIDNVHVEFNSALAESPFLDWKRHHFGDAAGDPSIAGDLADPDHDGLPNLAEYAFGLDPNLPDPAPSAFLSDGRLILSTTLDPSADVTVTGQWSDDLETWHDDGLDINIPPDGSSITLALPLQPDIKQAFLRFLITR